MPEIQSTTTLVRDAWKSLKKSEIYNLHKQRMISWRNGPSLERVEFPTRLDRARALGYKSKKGFVIVRARVRRGGRNKEHILGGRRPRRKGISKLTPKKSIQWIAEERTADHYPNMEVLNSYYVGEDGYYKYYEVILVDKTLPEITHDSRISWVAEPQNTGRVYRGLTSAGYKARGLRTGNKGSAKSRPSIRANGRLRR